MITEFNKYKDIDKWEIDKGEIGIVYRYNTILFHKVDDSYHKLHPTYFFAVRNYIRKHKLKIGIDTNPTFIWTHVDFLGNSLDEVKDMIDSHFSEIEAKKYNL